MSISAYIAFLVWIVILILASWLIDKLLVMIIPRRIYRMIITPGIIVHELSHAIACVFMRAKIVRIKFFAESGGAVEHHLPKVPIIGKPIIGMAPLFGVTLTIFGLAYYFGYHASAVSIDFAGSFLANFGVLAKTVFDNISFSLRDWQFWLFLYLIISLSASIAPSTTDLKHAAIGTVLIAVIVGLLLNYNIGSNLFATAIGKYLGWVVTLGAMFEIFVLIVITPIYIIKRAVRR